MCFEDFKFGRADKAQVVTGKNHACQLGTGVWVLQGHSLQSDEFSPLPTT